MQTKNVRVFVAKAKDEYGTYPCPLQEGNKEVKIYSGGKEDYEILSTNNDLCWRTMTVGGQLPDDACKVGYEIDTDMKEWPLFSAKSETLGVGSYSVWCNEAHFLEDGKDKVIDKGEIKILCHPDPEPVKNVSIQNICFAFLFGFKVICQGCLSFSCTFLK